MEERSLYLQQDDPFLAYLDRFPALHGPVNMALAILHDVPFTSDVLADMELERDEKVVRLECARDAAGTLAAIAREGGFVETADTYGRAFDRYCLALLNFFGSEWEG